MELNKDSNEQYMKDKKAFEEVAAVEKIMEQYKQDLKVIRRKIEDAEIAKRRAEEDKDQKGIKDSENTLKKLNEDKKILMEKGKKLEATLNEANDKVQEHFKEIEKDSELKSYIDKAITMKYNRQLNKVQKEQDQLESLRKSIEEKPEIENNLKGMIRANEKIEELKKELEGLDEVKDKARIDEINNKEIPETEDKYKLNKEMLMKRANVRKKDNEGKEKDDARAEITSEFLDKLTKEGFYHYKDDIKDKDGNIKIKKGDINLDKSFKKIAKGYEKKERFYNTAIQKVSGVKEQQEEKQTIKEINEESNENTALVPVEEKVSWWHPIKKFKAWYNRRKEKEEIIDDNDKEKNEISKKNKSKKFKEAYKYDIIRDYVNQREEEIRDEIKKEIKNRTNENKEPDGREPGDD